ncbi:MAG: DUF5714 domain-containing protein [Anaerovoracaceae bacterium]|jgi:hypothetical protein
MQKSTHETGCLICGGELIYDGKTTMRECSVCHQMKPSNAVCENGHFICDQCHENGVAGIEQMMLHSGERDPLTLLEQAMRTDGVHMHGPEHHSIVPMVLLTAFANNGGRLDLPAALSEAIGRGSQVPGGYCGFWGCCGAAIGAGIFASIVLGGSPLKGETWSLPQQLTAQCLNSIAAPGGPRCCKRDSRLAVLTAVRFSREHFYVDMPTHRVNCDYPDINNECTESRCPFYRG